MCRRSEVSNTLFLSENTYQIATGKPSSLAYCGENVTEVAGRYHELDVAHIDTCCSPAAAHSGM